MRTSLRTAFATLVLASMGTFASAASEPNGSGALNVLPDPGPRPEFDPADYAGYRRGSGTSTIEGHVAVDGPAGADVDCRGSTIALYPNTPYTRWIIATWAREVDGRTFSFGTLFPGDKRTGISIPPSLSPIYDGNDAVVQTGSCDGLNIVRFERVPAGNYIMVVDESRLEGGPVARNGQVIVQTPNGEYPMATDGGVGFSGKRTDGFILATHGALIVEPNHSYTLAKTNIVPIAHYLPRK